MGISLECSIWFRHGCNGLVLRGGLCSAGIIKALEGWWVVDLDIVLMSDTLW